MTLLDPLYEIPVKCPVCNTEPFISYRLKSKCQTVSVDELTVPSYVGLRGHADADLLPMAATVCPRCLYASTVPESFTRIGGLIPGDEVVLRAVVQEALLLAHPERAAVLTEHGVSLADFDRPRSPQAANVAYLLTARSALVKADHRVPRALGEAAAAHLYRAAFAEAVGGEAARREALTQAAELYTRVFEEGDHEARNLDQVLYLCIVLHLRLDRRDEASPFLVAFERLRERARLHGGELASRIRAYHERIHDLLHA